MYTISSSTVQNIGMPRGSTFPFIPMLLDATAATPIIDTSVSYILKIYSDAAMSDQILTKQSDEYQMITLEVSDTENWDLQNYYYTITATDSDGNSFIILKGTLSIVWRL
jgi:hypothetical protein